jgi:hypothetical protein
MLVDSKQERELVAAPVGTSLVPQAEQGIEIIDWVGEVRWIMPKF